ncbi:MAG: choice-of-anchor D domain-containing protein [Acidobacteriota bacterium]
MRWICCFALFVFAASAEAAPQLTVLDSGQTVTPGALIDYGLFAQTTGNSPVYYFFDLTNTGNQTLDLSAIEITGGERFVFTGVVPPISLAPGDSTRLNVRFRRNVLGTHTHTVTLTSNDPGAPAFSFHVQGTVAPNRPVLEVRDGASPLAAGTLVDYGSWTQTPNTNPVYRLYELRNAGALPLDLSAIEITGSDRFVYTGVVPPISLAPGASTTLNVRFRRDRAGTFQASVALTSNDPEQGSFSWQVRGTVTVSEPALEVSDGGTPLAAGSLVDYGTYSLTATSSPVYRLYTLTNRGTLPLDLTSVTISGGDRFVFTGVVPPITLAPGASTQLNVRFRRNVLGTHTHTVTLRTNDPDDDPFSWQVRGRIVGNGPHLEVRDGGRVLSSGELVDYGVVGRSDAGPIFRLFTLTNRGDQDLDLSAISIQGGATRFVFTGIVPPTVLPPGGQATLNVRFRRDVVGLFNAVVIIDSNDSPFQWQVRGEVRAAPEISVRTGAGTILAPGDLVPFPDTAVGTSNSVRFVIENHGESDLTILNPNSLVSGQSFFVNANGIENPRIPPGGQEDFRVALLSQQSNTWTGTVTIEHDGPSSSPFAFQVEGRTGEPDFSLAGSPTSLAVTHGASATATISTLPEFEFSDDIALAISGLPAAVTASFQPATTAAGSSATLTLATSITTPPGTYPLSVTGTSGGRSRSTELTLEVTDVAALEITAVAPDVLPQGEVTVVTLTGRGFHGAGAFVPDGPLTANDPPRWTPAVRVLSIAPNGRSMEIEVDCSDPRVIDFYNLVVDAPAGRTGAAVRVVPMTELYNYHARVTAILLCKYS